MKRLVLAVGVLLAAAACSKKSEEAKPPAAAESKPEAPMAAAPEAKPAAPEQGAASGQAPIDEAAVKKYIVYEKAVLTEMPRRMMELKSAPKDGPQALKAAADFRKSVEQAQTEALTMAKLDRDQARRVGELVTAVTVLRRNAQSANPAMKDMLEKMKAQLDKMTPEQRAEAEKNMKQIQDSMSSGDNLTEQRKQFGDAAVDAVLKHESELQTLHDQQMQLLKSWGTPTAKP